MKRTQNKTLDELGRELISRSRPNAADIDAIVSSPQLFDQIASRMPSIETSQPNGRSKFAGSLIFAFKSGKLIVGTVAAALMIGAFYFSMRSPGPRRQEYAIQNSTSVVSSARPADPPENSNELSPGRASLIEPRDKARAGRRTAEAVYRKPQPRRPVQNDEEFYPIYASGDPDEPLSGGKIVRVNMQRSSLLALGVNLPLENDTGSVTADLLVGPDGVTRAFRVIK